MPDGGRRLTRVQPRGGPRAFIVRASVGGLMVLAERRSLEPRERGHHHALRLIYQHGDLVAEHLGRSFRGFSDLAVVGADGAALAGRDVLPDSLGLDPLGQRERWSVGELINRGRTAAIEVGTAAPDVEHCIAAGLHEAARRDPMPAEDVSADPARALVGLALFDPPPPDRLGADEERAVPRILDRLGRRLEDDAASFRRRFFWLWAWSRRSAAAGRRDPPAASR